MNKLKRIYFKKMQSIIDKIMGNGLMQEENTASGQRYITEGMPELLRSCAEEGIVLLKNDGVLPLSKDNSVAIFGRCQQDWFYVGYGSGGDVHPPYKVSFMDGLDKAGIKYDKNLADIYYKWCNSEDNMADHGWWGHWPYFYPEMPLSKSVVKDAAQKNDVAVVVIGRAAGEDRDNNLKEGSYYLTKLEKKMLSSVCSEFKKVVVIIDSGNIMDMAWVNDYNISAVMYAWQLGQESGNAVANVLSGNVNPSGKLTDTIAKKYKDYPTANNFGNKKHTDYDEGIFVGYKYFALHPEKVFYPFGFGLSYTKFGLQVISFERTESCEGNKTCVKIKVTNTGNCAGKETVQIYVDFESKEGSAKIPKARSLVGFKKTKNLLPNESVELEFSICDYDFASFDETGATGWKDAFVLENGCYNFYVGTDSFASLKAGNFDLAESVLIEQCNPVCVPGKEGSELLRQRILDNLPEEIPVTENRGIMLSDVKNGKSTLDEFVAQLSDKELGDLTRGEGGMGSSFGIAGNAGIFGGITEELRSKGIPPVVTADGPAGLRVRKYTSLLPCGTAIACTWNESLVEEVFTKLGEEIRHFNVDVILSPGMNIHRNPLCGRNFEYYSEDPFLSGKMGAAAVRGIQKAGISACPKHFACNNQETCRNRNDSRISQQALREVYLRAFEICVKEGKPLNLMTSYNKINGVWAHYNYDLVTTVLRKEWKYEGNVVTDWWMRLSASPEFPLIKNNAYRVRAQVDVLMPGSLTPAKRDYVFDSEQLESLGKENGLTRAELQRSAKNVLSFILKVK